MIQPKIFYISGKTCTGKTTLSKRLSSEHSYPIIELDTIVDSLHNDKDFIYLEAYRGDISSEIVQSFIKATIQALSTEIATHGGVIFEGAIANPEILKAILEPWKSNYQFIYLHPVNTDKYLEQLVSRFIKSSAVNRNGLPSLLWNEFNKQQLEKYYKDRNLDKEILSCLTSYAKISMNESDSRLKKFTEVFDNIDVREL
jgi:adenylate kinase family enzyme